MTKGGTFPALPYPVVWEPSALAIIDRVQNYMAGCLGILDRVGLSLLAKEFYGLTDEQKGHVDRTLDAIRPQYRLQIQTMGQDCRPYTIWRNHRETYEPHSALTRELVRMNPGTKIPGDVLLKLRHINPLFILTGTPEITLSDGRPGRVIAFFVTGAVSRRWQKGGDRMRVPDEAPGNVSVLWDTHDPDVNAFHVMAVSEVLDDDRMSVVDLDWCHLTVPVREPFTLDELARVTADDGFNWNVGRSAEEQQQHDYLLGVARVAVAHLVYVCSRTVEVDDKPRASRPPARRGKGEPKPEPSARLRRVGWRLGATIQDSVRAAASAARSEGSGSGGSKAPHVRGAHLHTYLVGPGRQEVDVKWLGPIPVNMGKGDGTTVTRHRVK